MRLIKIFRLLGVAGFLGASIAAAQNRMPDALEQRASLVCNGTVLSIEKIGERPASYPSGPRDVLLRAKIKVLYVFKGQAPAEIEFRYHNHGPGYQELDGMENPILVKGLRYRFFLAPDGTKDGYVGQLDSEHNRFDFYDIESMSASEPDDTPLLHEKDAILLALNYLRSKQLESQVDLNQINAQCGDFGKGTVWCVNFSSGKVKGATTFVVTVRMDRTIDPEFTHLETPAAALK